MTPEQHIQALKELRDGIDSMIRALEPPSFEMSAEAREAARIYKREYMRDYMKKWRVDNPEKVRQSQIRYWENRAKKTSN